MFIIINLSNLPITKASSLNDNLLIMFVGITILPCESTFITSELFNMYCKCDSFKGVLFFNTDSGVHPSLLFIIKVSSSMYVITISFKFFLKEDGIIILFLLLIKE